MSTIPLRLCRCLLASGLVAMTVASAAHAATNKTAADLRIVADDGSTLVEKRQITGSTTLPTSKRAECFGQGTGGTGGKVAVPGSTALGIVGDAAQNLKKLRPLSLTDHFDFGVGICGFGGYQAPSTGYWYLKRNHIGSQAGGDQTPVKSGDQILWYLIDDYNDPIPAELGLRAPASVPPGEPVHVKVVAYADDGKRTPAAGATVGGVKTDAQGEATVPSSGSGRNLHLQATKADAIPSNVVSVCPRQAGGGCPSGHVLRIGGTQRDDRIEAGAEPASIRAYGGSDRIGITKARAASPVEVDCGGGEDTLVVSRDQRYRATHCEKVEER